MDADQLSQPSEIFGQRRYARFPVVLPVVGHARQFPGEGIRGTVRNVGRGGLMAEFPVQMVTGSALGLTLPTRWGPLDVEGKVVWMDAAEGNIRHGVAFSEPKELEFAVGVYAAWSR